MQPVGGRGDYVAPPTYPHPKETVSNPGAKPKPKPVHVFEERMIGGEKKTCVLLDSVQSQANRFEAAILDATRAQKMEVPYMEIDFTKTSVDDIGTYTTLEAPHRVFDAHIRDSMIDGQKFPDSDVGKEIASATPSNAVGLLRYAPTVLLLGGWNSTGLYGGLGTKFHRCMVSEIVGVNIPHEEYKGKDQRTVIVPTSKRPGSKNDPFNISSKVKLGGNRLDWEIREAGKDKASNVNHGAIAPDLQEIGVTMDYAQQTTTISIAAMRRLHFTPDNTDNELDWIARTALVTLGLAGITEMDATGHFLRSRCHLVPEPPKARFEIVRYDGSSEALDVDHEEVKKLYKKAVEAVKDTKELGWEKEPVRLTPQDKVVQLIEKSRQYHIDDKDQGG